MWLKATEDYIREGVAHLTGAVIEVSEEEAKFLIADAPGCFVPAEPEAKALDAPPNDKMLRPRKKK